MKQENIDELQGNLESITYLLVEIKENLGFIKAFLISVGIGFWIGFGWFILSSIWNWLTY